MIIIQKLLPIYTYNDHSINLFKNVEESVEKLFVIHFGKNNLEKIKKL